EACYALRGFGRSREAVVAVHSRPVREGGQADGGARELAEAAGTGDVAGAAAVLGLLRGELRVRVPAREVVGAVGAGGGGAPRQVAADLPLQAQERPGRRREAGEAAVPGPGAAGARAGGGWWAAARRRRASCGRCFAGPAPATPLRARRCGRGRG